MSSGVLVELTDLLRGELSLDLFLLRPDLSRLSFRALFLSFLSCRRLSSSDEVSLGDAEGDRVRFDFFDFFPLGDLVNDI